VLDVNVVATDPVDGGLTGSAVLAITVADSTPVVNADANVIHTDTETVISGNVIDGDGDGGVADDAALMGR
jgi:hypothetical protein